MTEEDHDKIIKIEAKLDQLCINIKKMHDDIKENQKNMIESYDKSIDRIKSGINTDKEINNCNYNEIHNKLIEINTDKISWKQFNWIIGPIVGFILSAVLWIGTVALENKSERDSINNHLLKHEIVYEILWEKVYGTPINDRKIIELYNNIKKDLHDHEIEKK